MILHYKTRDHPEVGGRRPKPEEQAWTFKFALPNGDELQVHMGRECHDTFRGFILNEDLDDAADEAVAQL